MSAAAAAEFDYYGVPPPCARGCVLCSAPLSAAESASTELKSWAPPGLLGLPLRILALRHVDLLNLPAGEAVPAWATPDWFRLARHRVVELPAGSGQFRRVDFDSRARGLRAVFLRAGELCSGCRVPFKWALVWERPSKQQ